MQHNASAPFRVVSLVSGMSRLSSELLLLSVLPPCRCSPVCTNATTASHNCPRGCGTASRLVYGPCTFSRLPCIFSRRPCTFSRLPCTFSRLPCTFSRLPCTFSRLPCTFSRLPCTFSRRPCTFSRLPCTFSRLPHTFSRLLCTFSRLPCSAEHSLFKPAPHIPPKPRI